MNYTSKLQHLYQANIRYENTITVIFTVTLFKLDELLMSLRKLFENTSASEFLRDIHWALFDIKGKNNEQCIDCKLHYVALYVHFGRHQNYSWNAS